MNSNSKENKIIGIDEAGRGPLAGPVSVAAILVNKKLFKKILKAGKLSELTDSKKLSEKKREILFKELKELKNDQVLKFAVTLVSSKIIDEKGISHALSLGIKRILKNLKVQPSEVKILLDGSLFAPKIFTNQKTIIRGDLTEPVISAASIIAKVTRDHYMKRLAKKFPEYEFEIHKGYGTEKHFRKIKEYGISSQHRKTFCKRF